jgi:hypothetical protein
MPTKTQTDNAKPPVPDFVPPIDPGDAGGVGNGEERTIKPGELHETAEEAGLTHEAYLSPR